MKRLFRGPWFWIVFAVVAVLLTLQYLSAANGATEVKTSTMQSYLTSGQFALHLASGAAVGVLVLLLDEQHARRRRARDAVCAQ